MKLNSTRIIKVSCIIALTTTAFLDISMHSVNALSGTLYSQSTSCNSATTASVSGVNSGQCFPVTAVGGVQSGKITCANNQATAILYTDSSCSNQAASGSVTGDGNSCGIIYQTSNNSPAASGKVQCDKTSGAANGFTTIFVGAVAACIVAFLI